MRTRTSTPRSGFALASTAVVLVILVSLAALFLSVGVTTGRELDTAAANTRAFYLAEAGLTQAIEEVRYAVAEKMVMPEKVASAAQPAGLYTGEYWATIADHGDGTFTVRSVGEATGGRRAVEATLIDFGPRPLDNAVFAGNDDGDPQYMLAFSGLGGQADTVVGDIYSGGGVLVTEDASISGKVRAVNSILGVAGLQGPAAALPDMAGMKYETSADIDVAASFASATWAANGAGGSAWQMPEDDPAHIFRKNPDDRAKETGSTAKDDFFLEDPYENVRSDPNQNGADAYHITLTGDGKPGPKTNEKVFFVDGNLWLHNKQTYSFKFFTNGQFTRVTFVVKGNIYFSDNLFYQNKVQDGVAFIAVEDPNEPDSGNIYFGDPEFGTLKEMNAYMYAQNDFYDVNLDSSGSAQVHVHGAMTAGNVVDIQRDFQGQHSKLSVEFDDRVSNGDIDLPGLPPFIGGGSQVVVASWREIPVP